MTRWSFTIPLLLLIACGGDEVQVGTPSSDNSDVQVSQDGGPDAHLDPGPDADVPTNPIPRFDPSGDGFYDTPWPSNARLTAMGTPDLAGFAPASHPVQRVIKELEGNVIGFANMPIVYFQFDGDITSYTLPTTAESLDPTASIQLLALGDQCGTRVPVEASIRTESQQFINANTLQVKNTVGTALEPGRPYAMIVLRSFGAEAPMPPIISPVFQRTLAGDDSKWSASLAPLRDCLATDLVSIDDLLIATVFTPQDPIAEVQAMRDLVMDPERVETRPPTILTRDAAWSRRRLDLTTYSGLVEMPVFQTGQTPYSVIGGGLERDADGIPIIQRWEQVPFSYSIRTSDPPIEGPRPVLVFIDGTGWAPWRHLFSGWTKEALDAGFIVFSFMPQFHGGRADVLAGPELLTFNFLNPASGRTNFRQQAIENAYFSRVIREQLIGGPGMPELNTDRLVYGGHSQGSLAGALTAAIDDSYVAYVFSGLAAYLTLTVLERKDLVDFESFVRGALANREPLDLYSPALNLMQTGAEAVDPHNFTRAWRGTPARPEGSHIFVINGFNDATTTPRGMDHLTLTGDLPTFDAPGWDIDPLGIGTPPTVQLPVQGNVESLGGAPLTIATYLDPIEDHFTIYRNATLRHMAVNFWRTALVGIPTLDPVNELMCGDGEDGDGDGQIDCADADCQDREPCVEQRCADGIDNDGDGAIDCMDENCAERSICQETDCGDGLDDDMDGLIDCADPGCANREPCRETRCHDRQDGDGDGQIDCADDDCARTEDCREFQCADGNDNDGDGLIDCDDDNCARSLLCPESDCADGEDNDNNGLIDCADPRCDQTAACPALVELECDDGQDDDGDMLIDCADPDCTCGSEACFDADLNQALGTAVYRGTLDGATDDWDPGDCTRLGTGKDAPDLAFRWTAPANNDYVISTLGSETDTVLTLYEDCDQTQEVACQDDLPGASASALAVSAIAGQSFIIVISAYENEDLGPVVLHVFPKPAE